VIGRDYVAHKDSESPDSRYGVLVLSHEAAVDKGQTEGNTPYLANLETRPILGEIRGTDYFEGQNQCDLGVENRVRALQDLLW